MKIIRWLLSHSFLILLIVAVIYGYMFWGNLAGEDTPAGKAIAYLSNEFDEVEEFVNAVKSKQAELSYDKPSTEQTIATVDAASSVDSEKQAVQSNNVEINNRNSAQRSIQQQSAVQSIEQRSIEPQPVSISNSHNQRQVEHDSTGPVESDAEKNYANQAAIASNNVALRQYQEKNTTNKTQSTKDIFVSPEVEKQLNTVNDHGKVVSGSQQSSEVKENWITARKAFYQRKYALSEQNYQKVIDSTEDNVDAYGELGNVYFNQGKKEQAASAYFEAAAILVRKGQIYRARSLMGLLRHLDKSKAGELQKLIDSVAS